MLGRTKLQGVTSESLFKDMIAGHARDLANSQTYSLENGGEVSLTLSYDSRNLANSQAYSLENGGEVSLTLSYMLTGHTKGPCQQRDLLTRERWCMW